VCIIIIIIMKAKIIVTLYIKNVTGAFYTVNYNENTLSVSLSVNAAYALQDALSSRWMLEPFLVAPSVKVSVYR